jgi:hypothetical protein
MMQEDASLFDERIIPRLPTFLTTNLSLRQMREQFGDYRTRPDAGPLPGDPRRGGQSALHLARCGSSPDLSPEDQGMGLDDEERDTTRSLHVVSKQEA